MEQFNALFTSKDALLYLFNGAAGGFCGVLARVALRFEDDDLANDKVKLSDFLSMLAWTLFGGLAALNVDQNSLLSLMLGIFSPIIYRLMEKTVPQLLVSVVTKNVGNGNGSTKERKNES